jgi:hypothetical protein
MRRGLAQSHETGLGILLAARRKSRSSLMIRAVRRKFVLISTCMASPELLNGATVPCDASRWIDSRSTVAHRWITAGLLARRAPGLQHEPAILAIHLARHWRQR